MRFFRTIHNPQQNLKFRRAIVEDLEFVWEVENDPENVLLIGQNSLAEHTASIQDEDHQYWMAELHHGVVKDRTPVKTRIGFVILKGCTNPHQSVELYRIALKERDKGYGYKFLKFIQGITFEHGRVHRVWIDVLSTNARAIAVYEKVGFIREGCLRECYRSPSGEFETLYLYAMLSHEYQKSNST